LPKDPPSLFEELLAEAVREPPLLTPGTALADGRFVVRALLGTGGMGVVYRATDTRRGQDVAIKVLSHVEPAGIYRLKQEFRSLSSLRHPSLVALHELHSDGGTWFFTMDLVAGTPLSRVRWTTPVVRRVFAQVAEAIQAIHRQGKLHRDLKPGNVMLTPDGRVVVLDFGLVTDQAAGEGGGTSVEDGLAGTPAYMAPEQAMGRATAQSDWYAFGTMLYEALFGRLPFRETGVAALARKREETAPRPEGAGDVPADLANLCMRLLERDAARRPGYPEIAAVVGSAGPARAPEDEPVLEPFVGREAELQVLQQALHETYGGRSAVVTVSGAPGIGKTRLVQRFLDFVRTDLGGVVLTGSCLRREHVPFRACDSLVDDLSRWLRTLPAERAASLLARDTPALAQIFPVLDGIEVVRTMERRPLTPDASEHRRLGLAALRELLGNIAAQERLVVFVDDMQWSDVDGARLLASLVTQAARPDAPALLLVVAHRTQDGGGPALGVFLERVASNPDLHRRTLRLQELGAIESRHLAGQILAGQQGGMADRIARESGGNPLFIRQLCRHVPGASAGASPPELEGLLQERIASLSADDRRTFAAICLTPRPVSLALLSRVADVPDPERSARELELAQLARFTSDPSDAVTAFHERIREVVLAGMDAGERRLLHARSVEALERAADSDLAALTLHYLGAGREGAAAACAVRAAGRATSVLAFEQSVAMYRLALERGRWGEAERVDLLCRLAEALALDHRSGEAGARFLEAASAATDAASRRALRLRAADQYLAGGWLGEGIGLLREVFAELGLDYDGIAGADLVELRRRLAERGLEIAARAEREIAPERLARLDALLAAGNGLAWLKPESTQFRFALALEAFDAGEPMRFACGLRTVARFDAQLDPDDERVHRVVRRLCDRYPGPRTDLLRWDLEAGMAMVRGRPWEEDDAGRRTEELLLRHPTQDARVLSVARFHQALALYSQGEVHELHRRCWGWLEAAKDRNDLFLGSWLDALLASWFVAARRTDVAREMCGEASRRWSAVEEAGRFNLVNLTSSEVLASCDVHDGDGSAWERLRTATAWFRSSPLDRIPFLVSHCRRMWARVALACAQGERPGDAREELLRESEVHLAVAAAPRGPGGRAVVLPHDRTMSTLLSAGLAAARGDAESALRRLELGLERMGAAGSYALLSAYARRARGILLAGSEGGALVAEAEAELRRMGVMDPARHARTVLPGFPS
jgi:hypothetical protein